METDDLALKELISKELERLGFTDEAYQKNDQDMIVIEYIAPDVWYFFFAKGSGSWGASFQIDWRINAVTDGTENVEDEYWGNTHFDTFLEDMCNFRELL